MSGCKEAKKIKTKLKLRERTAQNNGKLNLVIKPMPVP